MMPEFDILNRYGQDPLADNKIELYKTMVGSIDKFAAIEAEVAKQRQVPQVLRDSIEEYLGRFRTTTERAVEVVWETAATRKLNLHRADRTGAVDEGQLYQRFPFLQKVVELIRQSPYADFDMLALPEDYQHAWFDDFEILCTGHNVALNLLKRFGINPPKGLFFWGNYGTGKTHLVAAYALSIRELLELGYLGAVSQFTNTVLTEGSRKFREFNSATAYLGSTQEDKAQRDQLDKATDSYMKVYTQKRFEEIVGLSLYKPSDLAFITFDDLFDRRDDEKFVEAFLSRRIVITDDIHPKGERARMDLIQRVIERRYNKARTGATFMTSNISPEQLLNAEGYPKEVGERVHSRLQEMCFPIEFNADDFRVTKAKRQNEEIMKMLEEPE